MATIVRPYCALFLILLATSTDRAFANFAYVANQNGGNVSVIDTSTNTIVATIDGFVNPTEIVITPNGQFAYVSDFGTTDAYVINVSSNTVVATIGVGTHPGGVVAITPDGQFVYMPNIGTDLATGTVSVIQTSSNTVVATIMGFSSPFGIAITPGLPPTGLPPSGLTGVQKVNNFGVVSERYNTLSRQSSPSGVASYLLYRDGTLIATLGGSASSYEDHDQPKQAQTYLPVAVTPQGASNSAAVVVGGN